MTTRNAVSRIIFSTAPLFVCVAVFGQDYSPAPPPPPPVFASGNQGEGAPQQEYPGPQSPYQAQQVQPQPQPAPYQGPYPPQQPGPYNQAPPQYQNPPADNRPFPPHLTVQPGTWLPVRIEQELSSDRNQPGESFYATLADSLVVNGVVVAHRGQTVIGRITQAQKAGRTEGTSKLGLEITGITAADGENLMLHTRILQRDGQTSVGRDLAAIGQTTAMGAAIGGISEGGKGAGIGAGIGAAAGIVGVLLTRGRPTVVYPETLLTFEIVTPVEIDTTHSGAFRYADARDFQQDRNLAVRRPVQPQPRPYYGGGYGPYYGPAYGYDPYYYGGGYGTGFGIVIGRGYGGYGRYRGRR